MTIKFYSAKSSANRAAKKASEGYEAFIISAEVLRCVEGYYTLIILKSGAGRHLAEYLEERGMAVEFGAAEAPAPTLAEEKAAAQPMGKKDLPADEPEADEDEVEATEEEIRDYLKGFFALAFMNAGGNQPRGRCKALRAIAASWDGSRKEFIQAAEDNGILASTANANYQAGYKG